MGIPHHNHLPGNKRLPVQKQYGGSVECRQQLNNSFRRNSMNLTIAQLMDELEIAHKRIALLEKHLEKLKIPYPSPGFEYECTKCGVFINCPCDYRGMCISCTCD